MTKPIVFVGTLYSGEGDFDACLAAIRAQAGVTVTHFTVCNKPEREAHNALWAEWRRAKGTSDMFVKVDADTVLAHDEVLLELWRTMKSDSAVTGIQAPLLDYFTDGYINGLNCFSTHVTFRDTEDGLFCDRNVDVDHVKVVRSGDVVDKLRPAGHHCYLANDAQAFHFGLHRALKRQSGTIELVRQAYMRNHDRKRALALLGARSSGCFADGGFNYTDERFTSALQATLKRFDELVAGL